jgi:hypothetical protein
MYNWTNTIVQTWTNTVVKGSNCGACNLYPAPRGWWFSFLDESIVSPTIVVGCSLNEASLPNPTRFASPGNRFVHGRLLSCVVSHTGRTILNELWPSEFRDSATAAGKSRWTLLPPQGDLVHVTGGRGNRKHNIKLPLILLLIIFFNFYDALFNKGVRSKELFEIVLLHKIWYE